MTQVSRRKIPRDIETRMYETLWETFSGLKSSGDIRLFLDDLLSPPEKIMIAKRLAIATLLSKRYEYQVITDLLKVSTATISKVSLALNHKEGYRVAINKVARSEASREFWQGIENLIHRLGSHRDIFAPEEIVQKKLGHKKKTLL